MTSYRKIWEDYNNKKIPRGYHIHHIDGNKENNGPENLQCCSPEEHWWIHYRQGDPVARNGKWIQGANKAGAKGGKASGYKNPKARFALLNNPTARNYLTGNQRTKEQKLASEKHSDRMKGRPSWNKGLTKQDPRVAKQAIQMIGNQNGRRKT